MTTSVTIKDVATQAGVSPKTVSRVINGEAHVRPEVRDRVARVVRELDYRPNAFARGLSSSRSFLIGLFFDDPASAYAAEVQRGAMERCRRLGHHLLVERLEPADSDWRASLTATLKEVRLGGAILTPPVCDNEEVVRTFAEHGVQVVRISPEQPDHGTPQVRMDDRRAVAELVTLLIELGHRQIGFVGGNRAHSSAGRRWNGYLDAMNAAGLPIRDHLVEWGDYTFRSGLDAGGRLLDAAAPPTALFASNDEMAFGALVAATHRHVSVPDALSITGFDDVPISRMAWPQITTVRQPHQEMAEAAVEMLIGHQDHARAREAGTSLVLPYKIMVRDSCIALDDQRTSPAAIPTT